MSEGIESFFDLTALEEMQELVGGSSESVAGEDKNEDPNEVLDDKEKSPEESSELDKKDVEDAKDDEKKENNDDDDEQHENDEEIKESSLLPYAKLLVSEGILRESDIENFDGTADGLIEAEKKKFAEWQEQYKSSFDPRVKWLQDHIEAGVPLEDLLDLDREKVAINSITENDLVSDPDLQKDVVRSYYKATTKFSDERIEKEINRLDDLSELSNEAKSALDELKTLSAEKEQQLKTVAEESKVKKIEAQRKALADFKTSLQSKNEIIGGIEFSQTMKDKVYNTLTTVVAYDTNGVPMNKIAQERAKNPMEFETTLAYIFELTNGFKDFSPIASKGKKQAIVEFEKAAHNIDKKKFSGEHDADIRETKKTTMDLIDKFLKVTS